MKFVLSVVLIFFSIFFIGCDNEKKSVEKPYEGKVIKVIVPHLHANLIRGPIMKEAESFSKKTGAKIRVITPSWSETINSINRSVNKRDDECPCFDIYVVIGIWNGTLLANNHIEPVPKWVKDKIEWNDVLPIYKNNILSWNNIAYGMPYDGDNINLYYRKDIFNDKKIKAKFKKEFGYELTPPKTWEEYIKLSKFFTGWDWDNDGKIEYGNAGLRIKGDVSLLQFFAFAAAYAKHPDDKAYYFDVNTMKAKIDSPAFVRALEEYIKLIDYGPKGMKHFAGHDVRNDFIQGEVAMVIDWADTGIAAFNSPNSVIARNVGFAPLPGSNEVFNYKTQKWEKRFNEVSSISGSWSVFVNKNSKNKKLAFEFASHITSKNMTREFMSDFSTGVNPSRYSHFQDVMVWQEAGFDFKSAKEYLSAIKTSLTNKNVATDILIPGGELYYQVLDDYVYKAINGELTPKTALTLAAKEWEKITDKLGREKQKKYYKASLNLR